jgi:hypothetical protein
MFCQVGIVEGSAGLSSSEALVVGAGDETYSSDKGGSNLSGDSKVNVWSSLGLGLTTSLSELPSVEAIPETAGVSDGI